jgi:mannose-6-phosphate isomerase-like protein (cupin superfamily)
MKVGRMLRKVSRGTIFPREDGKIIDEHFGVLHTQQDSFSLAHMQAPPGWYEPPQVAEFDEVVIVLQGVLAVEADNQHVEVGPGETCMVDRGTKVNYSNASQDAPCNYWSLCMPAFRPERAQMGES